MEALDQMQYPIPIVSVLLGLVILFFGRRMFWLCVAAVGFAAGVAIGPHLIHDPSPIIALIVALLFGLVGALLALFLQKVAIIVVGFVAGGQLAASLVSAFFVHAANYFWITFLIGGIIGGILLLLLFDWALIVLSALVGAHLIQSSITLPATGATILFIVLAVLGIIFQKSRKV